jgi:hypothetical protein
VTKVVGSYIYCDASGKPLARIDRIEPGFDGAGKSFLPYLWNPSEGRYDEKPGLNGTRLPLYRLDEVRAATAAEQTIFFVEGEGKCDRLRAALRESGSREAVTTIAGGANAPFRPDQIAALAGAKCIYVLADSDVPGCGAATERAQAIASVNPRCDVRIIDLYPTRDDGSDVADWLRDGHTLTELDTLVESAPRVEQSPMAREKVTTSQIARRATREQAKRPAFVRASELLTEDDDHGLEYAVEGLLPLGGTAVLAGRPKGGKSTLALSLALAVARGEPFLGRESRKGTVLYLALEGAPHGWKALLRRLGVTEHDDLLICIARAPEAAIAWLREEIEKHGPVLVIVDTMQRLLRVKDGNDYATGSNATDAVIELARLANASLLMLHHSGKTHRAEIVDEVMGSTAWAAAVDTVLVLRRSERCRTLASEQRFGDNLPETVLAMDPATCRISEAGTKVDADRKATREAIVAFLRQHAEAEPDQPFTDEPTIEAGVGGRTKAQREALREAVAAGEIERIGTGKKGDRYLYGLPRSLVPDYGEAQENENTESAGNAREVAPNARSDDSREAPEPGTSMRDARNENPGTDLADALFAYANERIRPREDLGPQQAELDL